MNRQQTVEERSDELLEFLILITIDPRNPPDVQREALVHIRDIELGRRMNEPDEAECKTCPFSSIPPYNPASPPYNPASPPYNPARELTVQYQSSNYNPPLMLTNGTDELETQYRY
jgi:hypothetical protein